GNQSEVARMRLVLLTFRSWNGIADTALQSVPAAFRKLVFGLSVAIGRRGRLGNRLGILATRDDSRWTIM
ncbi:hypothetical protein ACCT32_34750, partial [Rhizobium brockwellii]|uniref:hypothetical protein n=1 Tax=Rhizobium brockwellii TaxID=3019932 RepID=UPI003F980FDA